MVLGARLCARWSRVILKRNGLPVARRVSRFRGKPGAWSMDAICRECSSAVMACLTRYDAAVDVLGPASATASSGVEHAMQTNTVSVHTRHSTTLHVQLMFRAKSAPIADCRLPRIFSRCRTLPPDSMGSEESIHPWKQVYNGARDEACSRLEPITSPVDFVST